VAILPSDHIGAAVATRGHTVSTQANQHGKRFTPYKYRGTGKDTITPNRKAGQPHPPWCYCKKHAYENMARFKEAGLLPERVLS